MWLSIICRIISATFWLIKMISISSLLTKRLKQSSISVTAVSANYKPKYNSNFVINFTYFYLLQGNLGGDFCWFHQFHPKEIPHTYPKIFKNQILSINCKSYTSSPITAINFPLAACRAISCNLIIYQIFFNIKSRDLLTTYFKHLTQRNSEKRQNHVSETKLSQMKNIVG